MALPEKLRQVADAVRAGKAPEPVSVRTLLSWFNAERRGLWVVRDIRNALQELGIRTSPDFVDVWIGATVGFELAAPDEAPQPLPPQAGAVPPGVSLFEDPTYRIGRLPAANTTLVSVTPDTSLSEAITLMLTHDFSQLPVMEGQRELKGIISWQSIGSRLALGQACASVHDCMQRARELYADTSLFDAIPIIIEFQYVLVRGTDRRITGIVTTTDLSDEFRKLAEPYLLLSEIENHIRRLIDGRFSTDDLKTCCEPGDTSRDINTVADMNFGEYVRLLENPARWEKLKIGIDRSVFLAQLHKVREIRNAVMHFDPDPFPDADLALLRKFVRFFQALRAQGVV